MLCHGASVSRSCRVVGNCEGGVLSRTLVRANSVCDRDPFCQQKRLRLNSRLILVHRTNIWPLKKNVYGL